MGVDYNYSPENKATSAVAVVVGPAAAALEHAAPPPPPLRRLIGVASVDNDDEDSTTRRKTSTATSSSSTCSILRGASSGSAVPTDVLSAFESFEPHHLKVNTTDQSANSSHNNSSSRSSSSVLRPRRPDRAVYVPRARRSQTTPPSPSSAAAAAADNPDPDFAKALIKINSHHNTTSQTSSDEDSPAVALAATSTSVSPEPAQQQQQQTCDSSGCEQREPLAIANNCDTTLNRQCVMSLQYSDTDNAVAQADPIMMVAAGLRIEDVAAADGGGRVVDRNDKDNDKDERELQRASKEINRSNRRLIKQTFKSDVLEITDPIEKTSAPTTIPPISAASAVDATATSPASPAQQPHPKLQQPPATVVDADADDWDSMFDDNGDCLNSKIMDEITASVGKVTIEKPKSDYKNFHNKQALLNAEEFPHVLEVSGFPVEFKTNDLMMLFAAHKGSGFDIKWVDDTHALAVFSSSKIAAEVLSTSYPFVQLKPLAEATVDSRARAKKISASLQPFRQRPETCAALARRLVTGALGVRLKTSREELENERRVLREAKERKMLAAKQRDEVWES